MSEYIESEFYPEWPDEIKDMLKKVTETARTLDKDVKELRKKALVHLKSNYAAPLSQHEFPSDFETYSFEKLPLLGASFSLKVKARFKAPYKIADTPRIDKIRRAGIDVNKLILSGALTKQQKQSLISEIMGEETTNDE